MSGLAKLFGFSAPKIPKPEKPKVVRMPTADSDEIQSAVRRKKTATSTRRGRASTILTDAISGSSGQTLGR